MRNLLLALLLAIAWMNGGCAAARQMAAQDRRDRCVKNLGLPDMFSTSAAEIEAWHNAVKDCEKQ